jgi:hypothetical protein
VKYDSRGECDICFAYQYLEFIGLQRILAKINYHRMETVLKPTLEHVEIAVDGPEGGTRYHPSSCASNAGTLAFQDGELLPKGEDLEAAVTPSLKKRAERGKATEDRFDKQEPAQTYRDSRLGQAPRAIRLP